MQEKDILALVGETITDKSREIEIKIRPKNWFQKLLMKKGFLPSTKIYEITPILVGNRKRISSVAVKLPKDTWENGKLNLIKAWETVNEHTDGFLYIVAVCIENRKQEPSKALIEELRWMPDSEFMKLLDASLDMSGITNFMKSIIWISGQNVLNVQEPDAKPVKEQE